MASHLRRLFRQIWLLIGGGGLLFIICALFLALTHPKTPANELINRHTVWLFLPSIITAMAGVYVSVRFWRCPHCGAPLRTRYPIPRDCPRCGRDIGLYERGVPLNGQRPNHTSEVVRQGGMLLPG